MLSLLIALTAPVLAQDADDAVADDTEFDFLKEGDEAAARAEEQAIDGDDFDMFADEDDLAGFEVAAKPEPGNAALVKQEPLKGHFEARIVETHNDSVVVELPVLLGTPDAWAGDFWLVSEVYVDGQKVGETRRLVTRAGLTDSGSLDFVKMHVPVSGPQGKVEVRISQVTPGGEATPLFSREALYRL